MSIGCCTGLTGCGCGNCRPANTIYRLECEDPGVMTTGRFLRVMDNEFCEGRLANNPGLLFNLPSSNGAAQLQLGTLPFADLNITTGVDGVSFGAIVYQDSNGFLRAINGPANKTLMTDAAGNVIFDDPAAPTIPDPLVVNNLTVGVLSTLANVTISGTVALTGIPSGTIAEQLGLDASNNLVKTTTTTGVASAMFFESATSPNASHPNENKGAGEYLVIGNELYDSGSNLLTVTNSETLTVAIAGEYQLQWNALCTNNNNSSAWNSGVQLEINGIVVNYGGIPQNLPGNITGVQRAITVAGNEVRALAVGDTLRLKVSPTAGADNHVWEARLSAQKFL